MKFKKVYEDVELPEEHLGCYINVRSAVRADVRPGETRKIDTGVQIRVNKGEVAKVLGGGVVPTVLEPGPFTDLVIAVHNPGERNLMIYPGQVIAMICEENMLAGTKPGMYPKRTSKKEGCVGCGRN